MVNSLFGKKREETIAKEYDEAEKEAKRKMEIGEITEDIYAKVVTRLHSKQDYKLHAPSTGKMLKMEGQLMKEAIAKHKQKEEEGKTAACKLSSTRRMKRDRPPSSLPRFKEMTRSKNDEDEVETSSVESTESTVVQPPGKLVTQETVAPGRTSWPEERSFIRWHDTRQ